MPETIITKDLAYYKGRLIDLEELIIVERNLEWLRAYLIAYCHCYNQIRRLEAAKGIN